MPRVVVTMLVVYWTAVRNIPKTSSELLLLVWCTSTAMRLVPTTRFVVGSVRKSGTPSVGGEEVQNGQRPGPVEVSTVKNCDMATIGIRGRNVGLKAVRERFVRSGFKSEKRQPVAP